MKKKIAVLIIMIALIPAFAFADILQLGFNAQLGFPMEALEQPENIDWDHLFQPENVYWGPELKLNLFFLDIDDTLSMQYINDKFQMRNDLFADLYMKLLFVKLSAGVGIQTQVMDNSELVPYDDFMNMIDRSFMTYRAGLGFCMGPVELNLQYMLPGTTNIGDRNNFYIPNPDRSTVSLSLLFDLA